VFGCLSNKEGLINCVVLSDLFVEQNIGFIMQDRVHTDRRDDVIIKSKPLPTDMLSMSGVMSPARISPMMSDG
jgi:hypothetical protein